MKGKSLYKARSGCKEIFIVEAVDWESLCKRSLKPIGNNTRASVVGILWLSRTPSILYKVVGLVGILDVFGIIVKTVQKHER